MKLFTEETLNSVWQVPPNEIAESHGVDLVDVPGDESFSAHRECVSDIEQAITIHGQPQTYGDNNNASTSDRYTRLRVDPEASWGLWASAKE
jgi:hypothetical protein